MANIALDNSIASTVEGLEVATPMFRGAVIPITVVILALLFAEQYRGTSGVGPIFGPVLISWFIVLAVLGVWQIQSRPDIPLTPSPSCRKRKTHSVLITLGALMPVVTGGEALYADLGHFGARPIRVGWFAIAFPALMINTSGKARSCLSIPRPTGELFYSMVPREFLYPMEALATLSTVIAAQGLISGAFSLASQAAALGLFPRLRIIHTHDGHKGQIYIPFVNWALFAGCKALVLGFRSTEGLAALYGLAVSGVMVITSAAMIPVGTRYWGWSPMVSGGLFGFFTLVNALFCIASSLKFLDGGYIPLGIGLAVFAVMLTWRWGRRATFAAYEAQHTMTIGKLVEFHKSERSYMERIGLLMTPKHLTSLNDKAPALLQLIYDRYGILPRHLIFVQVVHRSVPYITRAVMRSQLFIETNTPASSL